MTEMTEEYWENRSAARLQKLTADLVQRIRNTADQIEREAKINIDMAAQGTRGLEFYTYGRAAGQTVHALQTLLFNLPLDSLIDAASDAEKARTLREKAGDE